VTNYAEKKLNKHRDPSYYYNSVSELQKLNDKKYISVCRFVQLQVCRC